MSIRQVAAFAVAVVTLAGCEVTHHVSIPSVPSPSELATTLPRGPTPQWSSG